jgi:imidazolonepropionase-like amidohydrolase
LLGWALGDGCLSRTRPRFGAKEHDFKCTVDVAHVSASRWVAVGYLGGDKSFVEASQQASFTEASPRLEGEGSSASVGLPPIAGAQASFSSQGAHNRSGGKKRRSFNRYPPSHVHNANPALSRRYLGVR